MAATLVDAAGSGQLKRLGLCAGCGTAFAGTGRGRPARWCDMSTCGNRAKVAAFRARRRPAGDPPRSVDEALVRIATQDG